MTDAQIVSNINTLLMTGAKKLASWLEIRLPKLSSNWFQECVLDNLSDNQLRNATEKGFTKLSDFDLAALLRVTRKNWYSLQGTREYLPRSQRDCIDEMLKVRNNWAHCSTELPGKDVIVTDLERIVEFLTQIGCSQSDIDSARQFCDKIKDIDFTKPREGTPEPVAPAVVIKKVEPGMISEKDVVTIVSEPNVKGVVISIAKVGERTKYTVFVNGEIRDFFDGQIAPIVKDATYKWLDTSSFKSYLSAYELNNPSAGNLYSLNAARIDFVPYQFSPAIKMTRSDEPRILIADSVGVGKTIEAGLIIKELEARSELNNILIICPKPLVAERKWEQEMLRFDEEFTALDGSMLRQILSDTDRDGEWPNRYNKVIMPYSILDEATYEGVLEKDERHYGLRTLDPAPHFDLVIVDEAHYIRNGSDAKEKAFAYKCVKYFCDHSDAVVMLTATPLQNGDNDLFTLLNVLRPDLVIDKQTFDMMARPNKNIAMAAHYARTTPEGWRDKICEEMAEALKTQWGIGVIAQNPAAADVLSVLAKEGDLTRDERVKLISDIESLHSFSNIMNRTRRKDIQDFCVRKPTTLMVDFTPEQAELYSELLSFEKRSLSLLHNAKAVAFMMTTITRQAASSIFGLAPFMRDIVNHRFETLLEEIDFDVTKNVSFDAIKDQAQRIISLAENLPAKDPKFDEMMEVIREKQKEENNKIILFSTFRHTLAYLKRKIEAEGIRVAQVDGSVDDSTRRDIRKQFCLPKDDENAIDIVLFSEVGAEGLDYQFCNMMINYDLPWNPMKIEQRIGRIDRRGQQSESVTIVNVITNGTIDAVIYTRCLWKIGVFQESIGECDAILGNITLQIEEIINSTQLTEEERAQKLEQMADNEVRNIQALTKLETDEKGLFGFDLSSYTMSQQIENAESPWIAPDSLLALVNKYFKERLGEGARIVGESAIKNLRLSAEDRYTLKQDFQQLSHVKSAAKRLWEAYLKGSNPNHAITFNSDAAREDRKAFFITPTHPLVKQAAKFFGINAPQYICVRAATDVVRPGSYPFLIYTWGYKGINNRFALHAVCQDPNLDKELVEILHEASAFDPGTKFPESTWDGLEELHADQWAEAKKKHIDSVQQVINYKVQTLNNNFNNRRRSLESIIRTAQDDNLRRMKQSELERASEKHDAKLKSIEQLRNRADIVVTLIAKGVVFIG